ncbi:MAG: DUF6526 family protein [Pyrinomonadaceae bacterium]
MPEKQTFENHVRWHPPFHFVLTPILLLNFIFAIVRLVMDFNIDRVAYLILAFGLILLGLLARTNALRVQNRLIFLEEKLRYREVLPADLAERAKDLPGGQIIALRFADDDELPALVERALNDEFEKPVEIKRAIRNWRGDYVRV